MGILNLFWGDKKPTQIGKLPEHLPTIKTSVIGAARSTFAGSVGGMWASDHRTESMQDTNWDHIAIATICNQVASATVTAYRDGSKREINQSRRKAMRAASGSSNYKAQYGPDDDALQMLESEHSLMRILKKPNPWEPGSAFRYRQAKQLRLTGTCLVWNVPSVAGPACERYVIPVAMTTFQWPQQNGNFPFGSFKIFPNTSRSIITDDDPSVIINQDGSKVSQAGFQPGSAIWMLSMGITVDARQIQIIGYPHGWFLDDRQSPISAVALWKDADNAVNQARYSQMKNGVNSTIVWTLPPDVDPDQDEIDRVRKKIGDKYSGPENSGQVIVAQNGTAVTPLGTSAKDMEYEKGFEQYRDSCLANHGVNKATVGMTDQTSQAGLVTSMRQLEYIAVGPMCEMLAESDTFHLAPQFEEGLTVEIDPKKFNDEQERNARCQIAISGQCITKDTLAAILDLPLLGGEEGSKLAGPPAGAKPGADGMKGPELTDAAKPSNPNEMYGAAARGETTKTLTAALDGMREADLEDIDRLVDERIESKMKSFKKEVDSVLKARDPAKPYKFSSTQINLPKELADQVIAFGNTIPDDELADDGRENEIHVTVKYGIHGNDVRPIRDAAKCFGPIEIVLGETSFFSCEEYDVVKIDVESPRLVELNKIVADSTECTDTHPKYIPHVTVAYVAKGIGQKYSGISIFEGESFEADSFQFVSKNKIKYGVSLTEDQPEMKSRQSVVERQLASTNGNGHGHALRSLNDSYQNGFRSNGKAGNALKGGNPSDAIQKIGEWLAQCGKGMPGYGQIFIRENGGGEAWYVGGDGDERGFDKLVKSKLIEVPGIDDVTYESERLPPENEGWIQVYPNRGRKSLGMSGTFGSDGGFTIPSEQNRNANRWGPNGKSRDISDEARASDGKWTSSGSGGANHEESHITGTLYHGSHTEFDKFNDHAYLTPDSKIAGEYGKHVSSAKINVHNVFKPDSIAEIAEASGVEPLEENRFVFEELDRKAVRDALAKKGYDAVKFQDIAPNSGGDRTHEAVIVFHGKNVEKTGHQLRDGKMRLHDSKSLGMSGAFGSDGGFTIPEESATPSNKVTCPECGSEEVGYPPSDTSKKTCLECGHKWNGEPNAMILKRPEPAMKSDVSGEQRDEHGRWTSNGSKIIHPNGKDTFDASSPESAASQAAYQNRKQESQPIIDDAKQRLRETGHEDLAKFDDQLFRVSDRWPEHAGSANITRDSVDEAIANRDEANQLLKDHPHIKPAKLEFDIYNGNILSSHDPEDVRGAIENVAEANKLLKDHPQIEPAKVVDNDGIMSSRDPEQVKEAIADLKKVNGILAKHGHEPIGLTHEEGYGVTPHLYDGDTAEDIAEKHKDTVRLNKKLEALGLSPNVKLNVQKHKDGHEVSVSHDPEELEAAIDMLRDFKNKKSLMPEWASKVLEPFKAVLKSARWITINAKDGEGGTHIQIDEDGAILNGPSALKEAGIHHLSDFGKERGWRDHEHGTNDLMPAAHEYLLQKHKEREKQKASVRASTQVTPAKIRDHEKNGERDHSTYPRWDESARSAALENPDLGLDPDAHDTPAKVWELIREGIKKQPSKNSPEVRQLASTWAKGPKPKVDHTEYDDSEWKSLIGERDSIYKAHDVSNEPRDHGKWTSGGSAPGLDENGLNTDEEARRQFREWWNKPSHETAKPDSDLTTISYSGAGGTNPHSRVGEKVTAKGNDYANHMPQISRKLSKMAFDKKISHDKLASKMGFESHSEMLHTLAAAKADGYETLKDAMDKTGTTTPKELAVKLHTSESHITGRASKTLNFDPVTKSWDSRFKAGWITIGGKDGEGHGVHVKVSDDGKIEAGPAGLADKGIRHLSDFGKKPSELKPKETKRTEKKQTAHNASMNADDASEIAHKTSGKSPKEINEGHESAAAAHKDAAGLHESNGDKDQAEYHQRMAAKHQDKFGPHSEDHRPFMASMTANQSSQSAISMAQKKKPHELISDHVNAAHAHDRAEKEHSDVGNFEQAKIHKDASEAHRDMAKKVKKDSEAKREKEDAAVEKEADTAKPFVANTDHSTHGINDKPESKPAKKPGVPGQQQSLLDEEPSGQGQLFNIVKPKKGEKKPKPAESSTLEKIGDEQKEREAKNKPLKGQKEIE